MFKMFEAFTTPPLSGQQLDMIEKLKDMVPPQAKADLERDLVHKPGDKELLISLLLVVGIAQVSGLDGEALYEKFEKVVDLSELYK